MTPRLIVTASTASIASIASIASAVSLFFGAVECHAQLAAPNAMAGLSSATPSTRAVAFETLAQTPAVFREQGMPSVLVGLVERERALVLSTLRESGGRVGIAEKYGEEYAEYFGDLLSACSSYCDMSDPRTLRALADAVSSPSDLAQSLASTRGVAMLPFVLEKARNAEFDGKRQAVMLLSAIGRSSHDLSESQGASIDSSLAASVQNRVNPGVDIEAIRGLHEILKANIQLSSQRRGFVHAAIVGAALQASLDVRREAIRALGDVGTADDLAMLQRIAATDAITAANRGVSTYPLRDEARRAAAKIRPPL